MDEKIKNLFLKAKYQGTVNLEEKVWRTIVSQDQGWARIKLGIFSLAGILSLASLVPVLKMLMNDFTQSGFYDYLALAFSDSGSIVSHLKEFAFSLGESLPVVNIIFSFILIFIFLLSIKYLTRQIIRNQLSF